MATILDILISLAFGGALIVILLTATETMSENAATTYGERLVQESLLATSQQVEGDFRNMGFAVPDSQRVILTAESTRVTYRVDLPPFGSVDTVTYWLGATSDLSETMNEKDRFLYRRVGTNPADRIGIVTEFRLAYVNGSFLRVPFPLSDSVMRSIRQIDLSLEVESSDAYARLRDTIASGERTALYSGVFWKQTRLVVQNLDR